MLKAYFYRLYPTQSQEELLVKHFGCVRFVYNWALETKNKAYVTEKKSISCQKLVTRLPQLKKENEWLSEVNSQALQMAIRNLDNAFTNFFRRVKEGAEEPGFPQLKTRKSRQSFQCPQKVSVDFDNNRISLLKIPNIKTKFSRRFAGKIKTVTISKTKAGRYFVSILVDDGIANPKKAPITESTAVGIDLGLKDFAVLSSGEKISNPRFNQKAQRRIAKLQRKMAKQKRMNGGKHTKNREKTRLRLARVWAAVDNQRNDFLHKLSSRLVRENQTICIEDLAIQNMQKNHCLAGAIASVGWGTFVSYLGYKCEWYGKNLIRIGRFEPSTKICSVCGYRNDDLTLKDREWVCANCKTEHDRDVNAAINIKTFALTKQNLIGNIGLDKPESTLGEIEPLAAEQSVAKFSQ
jgi:putative transposase